MKKIALIFALILMFAISTIFVTGCRSEPEVSNNDRNYEIDTNVEDNEVTTSIQNEENEIDTELNYEDYNETDEIDLIDTEVSHETLTIIDNLIAIISTMSPEDITNPEMAETELNQLRQDFIEIAGYFEEFVNFYGQFTIFVYNLSLEFDFMDEENTEKIERLTEEFLLDFFPELANDLSDETLDISTFMLTNSMFDLANDIDLPEHFMESMFALTFLPITIMIPDDFDWDINDDSWYETTTDEYEEIDLEEIDD